MKHLLLRLRPIWPRVLPIVCSLVFVGQIEPAIAITISNIYAFGDSGTDAGNIYWNPPYWNGRHTNGPNWIDYVAGDLGFSMSPSNTGGNNYAVGGATTHQIRNIQVTAFNTDHGGIADPNALYAIWAGANDAIQSLNPATAAENVAATIVGLNDLGAELFVVVTLADVSVTPYTQSHPELRQWSLNFNTALAGELAALDNVSVFVADFFTTADQIIADPAAYGFTDSTHACWNGVTACGNPDEFLWWDFIHMSTAGYRIMADTVLSAIPMPGDYNNDLVVNDQDYDAWRSAFGSTVNRYLSADGNGDGVVDAADYTVWRDNLSTSAPGMVAANSGRTAFSIPEPTSSLAILVAAVLVYVGRTRLRLESFS